MKKLLLATLVIVAMASCKKDDPQPDPEPRKERQETYDRVKMEKVRDK